MAELRLKRLLDQHLSHSLETAWTGSIHYKLMSHGELMPVGKQERSHHGVAH